MLKKIFKISLKTIFGLFLFYLFIGLILIPFGLPWAIKSQGSKMLKHSVKVRSVQFNPFLWRINIKGFEILDADNQPMIGFDRLGVNVSFIKLFKKEYRVESVKLDGLKVNAALLPDGRINLMDLVPEDSSQEAAPKGTQPQQELVAQSSGSTKTPDEYPEEEPLPLVIINEIVLENGRIRFTDQSVNPNFSTALNSINIHVTGFSTDPESEIKVVFKTGLDEKGEISGEALSRPFEQPLQLETTVTLNSYDLQVLTPYIGKYTGRTVAGGKMDFSMNYRIADNKLTATHKLLIQRFDFGSKVESDDALNLPFGFAVALLEDPQGRIDISLPVKGDMDDPEFEYFQLLGQVAKNFFTKLVTKPFTFLASMIGAESGTEELGYARFAPGRSELSEEEKEKLKTLMKGLQDRPRLYLEINGSYDPDADWKAIKTAVFNKEYQALQEESLRTESRIYQQLYQRHFGIRALWALTINYKLEGGGYDEAKLNKEIKRQIIEDAPPDKVALEELAQKRAEAIYSFMDAAGFDKNRLTLGQARESQSSLGLIPLEFTLTIFDSPEEASEESPVIEAPDTNQEPSKSQP